MKKGAETKATNNAAGGAEHDHAEHDHGGMMERGVTRSTGDHGMGDHEQRLEMLRMHHKQTLWIPWMLVMLGVWTMISPFTFGYLNESLWVQPSGGRGVWFSDQLHTELRAMLMTWSDLISGLLLIVFGWRYLTPNRPISGWICCFVGIWLSLAPILFWAPTAAGYLNDTLVGMLVIALVVLIPMMPNMMMYMKMGPEVPPGCSYNLSSWPQRWIMIVLGFAGLMASRYLAAFQLGYIDSVWDPFFGDGTRRVLNSNRSHSFPVSDAALGALAFTIEFLMSFMGSPKRWRTMPWMVTIFGIVVIPLGLVHVILVASQPVMVGMWCTLCLFAAAVMLPMIPLEIDEVAAMGQFMKRAHDRGEPFWHTFWKGGTTAGGGPDERSPELMTLPHQPGPVFKASVWGMSMPWTLGLATILGLWLLFAPGVLGIEKPAANVSYIGGSLVITVAVIAMAEIVRAGRYLLIPLGLAVAVLPWFLEGGSIAGQVNALVVGLSVTALALPRGPKTESLWVVGPVRGVSRPRLASPLAKSAYVNSLGRNLKWLPACYVAGASGTRRCLRRLPSRRSHTVEPMAGGSRDPCHLGGRSQYMRRARPSGVSTSRAAQKPAFS